MVNPIKNHASNFRYLLIASFFIFCQNLYAAKTNQALYEDPFDQASGGASLTRATQTGMLFANPAQLPYGGKILRWLGFRMTLIAGKQSIDTVKDVLTKSQGQSTDTTNSDGTATTDGGSSDIVDQLFKTPLHVGTANSISFITNNFGLAAFYRVEPDIKAEKIGANGLPAVVLTSEAYAGLVASAAIRSPWRFLSFGVTGKYLYAAETDLTVDVSQLATIESMTKDGGQASSLANIKQGIGFDGGMLMFWQNPSVDVRVAGKVDDFGNTSFPGDGMPQQFKQTYHAGLGLTFHNSTDAIHLSADYRDILGAYEEKLFKRLYLGAKLMLRSYVGLGFGLYQGAPSYGVEIDLILMRLTATAFTREYSTSPGIDPRPLYLLSLTSGFDF